MKNYLILVITICCLSQGYAQEKHTISGTILDGSTGEFLIGATIYSPLHKKGVSTNNYGFYSLTLPANDSLTVSFSYLGYLTQNLRIPFKSNRILDIKMALSSSKLSQITVSADRKDQNVTETQMSVVNIPTVKIKEVPAILGEVDVLKVVQLLPGVQSGNEGTTGFHVRGGNTDQNLVQLDEAVIYNPNHLVGIVSSFNSRAINNVSLIKGGFPAQYGGRLSSILDVSLREGNRKQFGVDGGIGLISSQLTLEGPIKKDVSSFIVSGRRTYFDIFLAPLLPPQIETTYTFYDLNAKANYQLGPNDRIFVSGFKANDDAFYVQDGIEYNYLLKNEAAALRWNHFFSPRLFLNTSFILTSYRQDIAALQDNAFSQVVSGIDDITGKAEFQYFPDVNHHVKFGGQFIRHTFRSSGDSQVFSGTNQNTSIDVNKIPKKKFNEFAIYINDEIELSKRFSASVGLRAPGYYNNNVSYYKLEPRSSLQLGIDKTTSLKASYTMMNQFLHLIPSSTASVPTDVWIPSTKQTKPQFSQQVALGLFKNFKENKLESNFEIYYKTMENQVLFEEGNQLIASLDVDEFLVYGEGWSYGAELFVKKNFGRFSGWGSYTLSWTYQKFPDLNLGQKFPFRYDNRHNLSLVGAYKLNDKWTLSGTFVLKSGAAYTVPVGRTVIIQSGTLFEGNYYIYEGRNNARLNPYHRLDLAAANKKEATIFKKKYIREWVFSIYNVYSHQNPYFVYFEIDPATEEPIAKQVSLLPIIPSITFNFKFN